MTKTLKTCAVKGELLNGHAACGHYIAHENRCGLVDSGCEHSIERPEDKEQSNES